MTAPHANPVRRSWDRESVSCLVCHTVATEGEGVYHADLRALTCRGDCHDVVADLSRLRDRSARGRWRPVRQVVALADGSRCDGCAVDDEQEELP